MACFCRGRAVSRTSLLELLLFFVHRRGGSGFLLRLGRWQGAGRALWRWCRRAVLEGRPGAVVPGEPCWRWNGFHRLFLVLGWIHLHGLHTVSLCSQQCLPLTPPPLPPRFLRPSLFSPAHSLSHLPCCCETSWYQPFLAGEGLEAQRTVGQLPGSPIYRRQ